MPLRCSVSRHDNGASKIGTKPLKRRGTWDIAEEGKKQLRWQFSTPHLEWELPLSSAICDHPFHFFIDVVVAILQRDGPLSLAPFSSLF